MIRIYRCAIISSKLSKYLKKWLDAVEMIFWRRIMRILWVKKNKNENALNMEWHEMTAVEYNQEKATGFHWT